MMPGLQGLPLEIHLDTLIQRFARSDTVYNYPFKKVYRGFPNLDLSVELFGKKAATPLGPAAGPHTQMTQNIIVSYLAGARVIELKTIQVLEHLKIPRPCIDMRNVGYNIEWSQELCLNESYAEYLKAWIALQAIRYWKLLDKSDTDPFYDFIFDMSVGYDLKGLTSPKVSNWLKRMRNAEDQIQEQIYRLPARFADLKQLCLPAQISNTVTLSTFHGCPAPEIEGMVQYLIQEHQLNVIVKMNPTILGYHRVKELLIRQLGYRNIHLDTATFKHDLALEESLQIMQDLQKFAQSYDLKVGVKFSNTLVVKNSERIFKDRLRYLSGPPLYLLALNAVKKFREGLKIPMPISFSGGINKLNFAEAIACNLKPVTSCTDLLKKGGYSRLYGYLVNLESEMQKLRAQNLTQFIINSADRERHLDKDEAAEINLNRTINEPESVKRYHWINNRFSPKKINSKLKLFDCLNCNICIPVCPNGANFTFKTDKIKKPIINYLYCAGTVKPILGEQLILNKEMQIGTIAEFCNDCGNCETFCPEEGAPFKMKPRFFILKSTFKKSNHLDGFFFMNDRKLLARMEGKNYTLQFSLGKREYHWFCAGAEFHFDSDEKLINFMRHNDLNEDTIIITWPFHIMRIILEAFRTNPLNFPLALQSINPKCNEASRM